METEKSVRHTPSGLPESPVTELPPALSLGIYPKVSIQEITRLAQLLDGTRIDTLWIADSHLIWRECWSTIAACALVTDSLRLGSAVSNPLSRHPTVLAAEVGTIQELSGGRVRLGLGVGDSALRMTLGRVAKLSTLRSVVSTIRDLLETGQGTFQERDLTLSMKWPGTEIYISGSGPKTLAQAGEIGDGAIIVPGFDPERIAQTNAAVDKGVAMRPEHAPFVRRVLWVACSIRAKTNEALQDVRPFVASLIRHPTPFELPPQLALLRESLQESYDFNDHMAFGAPHAEALADEVAREFAVAGTLDEVKEAVRGFGVLRRSRIDEVALVLMGPDIIEQATALLEIVDAGS